MNERERGRYIMAAIQEQTRRIHNRTGGQQFFCCVTPDQFRDLTIAYLGYASDPTTKLCQMGIDSGWLLIRGDCQAEHEGVTVVETTGLPVA